MAVESLIWKNRYLFLEAAKVSNNNKNLFYEYTESITFYLSYRIKYHSIWKYIFSF